MSGASPAERWRLVPLAADACLFSAALFCLLIWGPSPLAVVLGPIAAWYLRGVPLDRRVLLGGLAGLAVGFALAGGLLVLAPRIVRSFAPAGTPEELAGAAIMLAAFGGAFAIVVLALLADAIRDLAPARRLHRRLDVARLAATAVVALFAAVVVAVQYARPESEVGDAGVFALAAAFVGGIAMLVAEPVRRRLAPPVPAPAGGAVQEDAGSSTDTAQR